MKWCVYIPWGIFKNPTPNCELVYYIYPLSQSQKSPLWSVSHHSLKCMLACVELWYMNTLKRACCTSSHYLSSVTKFRQNCTTIFTAYVLIPKKKAHHSYGLYNLVRVVTFMLPEKARRNMNLSNNMFLFMWPEGSWISCLHNPAPYLLDLSPVYVIIDGIFG